MSDHDPASRPAEEPGAGSARGRGLLGMVLALLLLAGGGLLWSSSMVWAVLEVQRDEPLPPLAYAVNGSTAVPMVVAGGFIVLAAVVAVLATRTIGRRIIAAIVLVTTVVTAVAVVQWVAQSDSEREASMLVDGIRHAVDQAPEASALAVPLAAGALVLAAAASIALLVTKNLALMSSKYERGDDATKRAARATDDDPQARDRDMWSSLDRGEDPTSTDPDD